MRTTIEVSWFVFLCFLPALLASIELLPSALDYRAILEWELGSPGVWTDNKRLKLISAAMMLPRNL
jgi:hypothetical protein